MSHKCKIVILHWPEKKRDTNASFLGTKSLKFLQGTQFVTFNKPQGQSF